MFPSPKEYFTEYRYSVLPTIIPQSTIIDLCLLNKYVSLHFGVYTEFQSCEPKISRIKWAMVDVILIACLRYCEHNTGISTHIVVKLKFKPSHPCAGFPTQSILALWDKAPCKANLLFASGCWMDGWFSLGCVGTEWTGSHPGHRSRNWELSCLFKP